MRCKSAGSTSKTQVNRSTRYDLAARNRVTELRESLIACVGPMHAARALYDRRQQVGTRKRLTSGRRRGRRVQDVTRLLSDLISFRVDRRMITWPTRVESGGRLGRSA
jgi:hypothetical protein